jgi:hypothetical protein
MLVQRKWLGLAAENDSQIATYTDVIDVWDSGNIRYERFSNGDDYSWEVIKRELNDDGFTEILKEAPLYKCPFNIVWQESYPALLNSQGFKIPGWSVVQTILIQDKAKAKPENSPAPGRGHIQRGGNSGRGRGRSGRGGGSGRNINR